MKNTTATHFIEVYYSRVEGKNIYTHPLPIRGLSPMINVSKKSRILYTVCVFLITPKNKENELKSDATKGA